MTTTLGAIETLDLIEEGVIEAYEADGYTKLEDGKQVLDRPALAKAVLAQVIKTRSDNRDERQAKAITKGQIAKIVFPSTPEPDPNDEVEVIIRKKLVASIGSLIQTGRRGVVQKMVAARKEGLVMCATTLGDDEVPAVYVTADPDLIDADFATPRTARLRNVAEETAKEFNFVIEHKPELKKRLDAKMDKGLKQAQIAAKAVLALTAGGEADNS